MGSGQDSCHRKLSVELEIEDHVNFLGQIPRRLTNTIQQGRCFCSLFVVGSFPKFIGGNELGCKVVATRVDSIPRVMGADYPFLTDSNDLEDLSNKLSLAISAGEELGSSYSTIRKPWNNVCLHGGVQHMNAGRAQ